MFCLSRLCGVFANGSWRSFDGRRSRKNRGFAFWGLVIHRFGGGWLRRVLPALASKGWAFGRSRILRERERERETLFSSWETFPFVVLRGTNHSWQSCEGTGQFWHFLAPCASPTCFKNIPGTLCATPVLSCSCTRWSSYRLIRSSRPGKLTSFFPFPRAENPTVTTWAVPLLLLLVELMTLSNNDKVPGLWSSSYPTNFLPRF